MRFHKRTSLILLIITLLIGLTTLLIAYQLQKRGLISPEEEQAAVTSCLRGSECPACPYPLAAFCSHELDRNCSAQTGKCTCVNVSKQVDPWCNGKVCGGPSDVTLCNPFASKSCPTGTVKCGTSVNHEPASTGCKAYSTIKCTTSCRTCSNKTYMLGYCKPLSITPSPTRPVITNTPTPIRTNTPTPTEPIISNTPTPIRTNTPTPTTPVVTNTPTNVATPTPTRTTVPTLTPTTPVSTNTPTPIRTSTPTPTGIRSITPTPTRVLPQTALISDEADRFIIGILMIFIGWSIYWFGISKKMEQIYWNSFVKFVRIRLLGEEKEVFVEKFSEKNLKRNNKKS